MSGYKRATITISEEEYRRLHDVDMKQRFMQKEPAGAVSNEGVEQVLNMFNNQFVQRQEHFEQYMEALGNEIGDLESRTAQTLVAKETELLRKHSRDMDNLWENTTDVLDILSKEFQVQIAVEHQYLEDQIQNVNCQLITVEDEQRQKYLLAETWLHSASVLAEFITQNYEHGRFTPGGFESIEQQLQQANENYIHGMPEAALLGAQQAYSHFSGLRLQLEQRTNEWQLAYQMALKAAIRLRLLVTFNSTCSALDAQGHELSIRIKLQDWSQNRYLKLVGHIEYILDELQVGNDGFQTAELMDLAGRILPGLEKEFDSMIYQARLAVLNSQLRVNIADIALRALEEQGFVMNEAGYLEGDRQNSYLVEMRNIEGSNVIIRVDPMSDADQTNALVIESQDFTERTEHELKHRSQEIFNALLQHGLCAGTVHASTQAKIESTAVLRNGNTLERHNKKFRQLENDRTD